MALETQTAKINVVISLKDIVDTNLIMKRLKVYCENNTNLFAFILHNKDTLENGEIKTPHIHLVALLKNNRQRLGTTLNHLSNALMLSPLAISIEKMSDLVGSIHYLIHKDNKEKYQYDKSLIVTNISEGELTTYLASDSKSMSIEYLIEVVSRNRSKIDIMREIGLTYYHLYRNTINDIYKEMWESQVIRTI